MTGVWGYWDRDTMNADTDVADVDAEAEFGVRTYAALLGYQRLQNDRMLFQQWLTNIARLLQGRGREAAQAASGTTDATAGPIEPPRPS